VGPTFFSFSLSLLPTTPSRPPDLRRSHSPGGVALPPPDAAASFLAVGGTTLPPPRRRPSSFRTAAMSHKRCRRCDLERAAHPAGDDERGGWSSAVMDDRKGASVGVLDRQPTKGSTRGR
jgi:hypothetical protein